MWLECIKAHLQQCALLQGKACVIRSSDSFIVFISAYPQGYRCSAHLKLVCHEFCSCVVLLFVYTLRSKGDEWCLSEMNGA